MQRLTALCLVPGLVELQIAMSNHILSKQQVDILPQRAEDDSYRIIRHRHRCCNDESLVPCLPRSVLLFYWSGACIGGSTSYLSTLDRWKFRERPLERSGYFCCIAYGEAGYVAFNLRNHLIQTAIAIFANH
jgi:hypothetical protein